MDFEVGAIWNDFQRVLLMGGVSDNGSHSKMVQEDLKMLPDRFGIDHRHVKTMSNESSELILKVTIDCPGSSTKVPRDLAPTTTNCRNVDKKLGCCQEGVWTKCIKMLSKNVTKTVSTCCQTKCE